MKGPGFPARFLPSLTVVYGLLLFAASEEKLAGAPTILGPGKCTSCHDHDKQKQWADKDTHTKALEQLEDAKAKKYVAALGLADAYNLKGPCVACHATVFNNDANAGVSCETCHGPGSAYLEPHQKKGSHAESVRLGLVNTRESYAAWGNLCINCHVVTDRKLTAAGHSSGADFELAVKSKKLRESSPGVKHWEPQYEDSKLAEAGRTAMRARTGGTVPPKPEAKPQAAPPAATASPARAATATVTKPQPKATPTAAPAPVRTTVEERPAPSVTATKPPPPRVSPTPAPEVPIQPTAAEKPAARPRATETAVAPPTAAPAPRTAAPGPGPEAAATPGIVIRIEVTPVPTTAPRVQETPPPASPALEVAPSATPSPRPTRRPTHRKPRLRPTARPQAPGTPQPAQPAQSAQPQPTPSPTRVRAPTTMSVPH
jgi:hypothetical protein